MKKWIFIWLTIIMVLGLVSAGKIEYLNEQQCENSRIKETYKVINATGDEADWDLLIEGNNVCINIPFFDVIQRPFKIKGKINDKKDIDIWRTGFQYCYRFNPKTDKKIKIGKNSITIILIEDAWLLNSSRDIIEDITYEIKENDGIIKQIQEEEYIRVLFEVNLTEDRIINIYMKNLTNNHTYVELYKKDSNELITKAYGNTEKVSIDLFLEGMVGEEKEFDLRIKNGSLDVDLIIDPDCSGVYLGEAGMGIICDADCEETGCDCYWQCNGGPCGEAGIYYSCEGSQPSCTPGASCTLAGGGEPPLINLPPYLYNTTNNVSTFYAYVGQTINFSTFSNGRNQTVDSVWFTDYLNLINSINESFESPHINSAGYVGQLYYTGNSFHINQSGYLYKACAGFYRYDPYPSSGNITMTIQKVDASEIPTGDILANSTLKGDTIDNISSTNRKYCFNFTSPAYLEADQKYGFYLSANGISNFISFRVPYSSTQYTKGKAIYKYWGWYSSNNYDVANFSMEIAGETPNTTNIYMGGDNLQTSIIKTINRGPTYEYTWCVNDTLGLTECKNLSLSIIEEGDTQQNLTIIGSIYAPNNGSKISSVANIDGNVSALINYNCIQIGPDVHGTCATSVVSPNYQQYGAPWRIVYRLYDNNFLTHAYGSSGVSISYMNITYAIPSGATNDSKWRVKDRGMDTKLPIPTHCWDSNSTYLKLRVGSRYYSPNGYNTWDCFNNTGWTSLRSYNYDYVYEEEMHWDFYGVSGEDVIATAGMMYKLTSEGDANYSYIPGCGTLDKATFDCEWDIQNITEFPDDNYDVKLTACSWGGFCNESLEIITYIIDRSAPRTLFKTTQYPTNQISARTSQNISLHTNMSDNSTAINNSYADLTSLNGTAYVPLSFLSGDNSAGAYSRWGIENITITNTSSGIPHPIFFYTNDSSSPQNQKVDLFTVYIDNENPTYVNMYHRPEIIYNNTTTTIFITLQDNYELDYYNLSYGSSSKITNVSEETANQEDEILVYTGSYNYTYYIYDDAGNLNTTIQKNFTVLGNENPIIINLLSPGDNNVTPNASNTFFYNYTGKNASTCTVYFNETRNTTTIEPSVNTTLNFTNIFENGLYTWQISCNNSDGKDYHSDSRILNVTISGGDTSQPSITNFQINALNSSRDRLGGSGVFNTLNLTAIEYMRINFTVSDISNISGDMTLYFTANGTNGCSLGNNQSSQCYNASNGWIEFKNDTNTNTFKDEGTQGDFISCSYTGVETERNYSCLIDEHYNPNVFKTYDADYNFSDIKWQNGTNQKITQDNGIIMQLSKDLVPLNADQYKIDFRVNYTQGINIPFQPLVVYACNSSYSGGDVSATEQCALIAEKEPSELQDDGTKFRGIFTKEEIDTLGDIACFVIETDENNPNKYYQLKTYKAKVPSYATRWNYTNDGGVTWDNLGDGYESELNINWFYDGTGPTEILFKILTNDSLGNQGNSSVYNQTWSIDATNNYPPIITINNPKIGSNVSGTYEINWTDVDPNDNNRTKNITLSNGTDEVILVEGLATNILNYTWDTTANDDGIWNLTISVYENDTTELYYDNSTHQIRIDNTPPSFTNLANKTTYNNTGFSYNLDANDISGIETFTLNQTTNFTIDGDTGIITNATYMNRVSIHWLNVSVNDTLGNTKYSVFYINITEPQIQTYAGAGGFHYNNPYLPRLE